MMRTYCLSLCLLLAGAAGAAAQPRFLLPLEVGSGVFITEEPPYPFTADFRIHPTWAHGGPEAAFRIGATGVAAFDNPGIALLAGGRLSLKVHEWTVQEIPVARLDFALEALYGTRDRAPLGGAVVVSLGRLFQITARGAYDVRRETVVLQTSFVGTDLALWLPR